MSRIVITNFGLLMGAAVALVMMLAGHAPLWAYGLWTAIGATTVRRIEP